MSTDKKIKSALISVFYKNDLDKIVKKLAEQEVEIYSTGGTQKFIESLGVKCKTVEGLTGYPSILGGRVKTLHPKVFGGILARRDNETDAQEAAKYEIPMMDLVIVDLYPFEQTVASGASDQDIIEKIDIGGISLIRAAAKNYKDVVIVPSTNQYADILEILENQNGVTSLEQRREFAKKAFAVSSYYDSKIFTYFDGGADQFHANLRIAEDTKQEMRYGENPHQKAMFFGDINAIFDKLHGKDLSYNNMLDVDAAVNMMNEFDETTFIIMKHNNACGVACRETLLQAWKDCLACDPVSAFGGVVITNRQITKEVAAEMNSLFMEVIIAPGYDQEALEILETKKNRIILVQKITKTPSTLVRSALNGFLYQERDLKTETPDDLTSVTNKQPTAAEIESMLFANKIVKHSKSNAIVLANHKQLYASGIGQTSRVDALKQAIEKAKSFGFDLNGAVMASDAFFPFGDCVELAHKAGITSVIQPGGSVRDNESIDYCNKNGVAMVFTGIRHFKH